MIVKRKRSKEIGGGGSGRRGWRREKRRGRRKDFCVLYLISFYILSFFLKIEIFYIIKIQYYQFFMQFWVIGGFLFFCFLLIIGNQVVRNFRKCGYFRVQRLYFVGLFFFSLQRQVLCYLEGSLIQEFFICGRKENQSVWLLIVVKFKVCF